VSFPFYPPPTLLKVPEPMVVKPAVVRSRIIQRPSFFLPTWLNGREAEGAWFYIKK
jgi:hypothetical protein